MGIPAQCGQCGKKYNLKDEMAGKKIRCPKCKGVIAVAGKASAASTRGAPPPRPPKQPKHSDDPNATSFTQAPQKRQPQPAGKKLVTATTCPNCGKAMPGKSPACPACGFNVRLGRRMSITEAIRRADQKPGVRADGSTYVTRAEKAEIRHQTGLRYRLILVASVLAFIAVSVLAFLWAARSSWWGPDLKERAASISTLPRKMIEDETIPITGETLHPYCIGYRVDVTVPKADIRLEKPTLPDLKEAPQAWARLAEAMKLPRYVRNHFPEQHVRRILLKRLPDTQGSFTPRALEAGNIKIGENGVPLLREAAQPEQNGFLNGALLDVGADVEGFLRELQARGTHLTLNGELYFIAVRERDLADPAYRLAMTEELERVPPASAAGAEAPPEPGPDEEPFYYFFPVIRVKLYSSAP